MKISQKTIATKANNNSITKYMVMSSIEPQNPNELQKEKSLLLVKCIVAYFTY